jgi:hypothetical protein
LVPRSSFSLGCGHTFPVVSLSPALPTACALCSRQGLRCGTFLIGPRGAFAHSRIRNRFISTIRGHRGWRVGKRATGEVVLRRERPREVRHERHSRLSERRGRAASRGVGAWAWREADVTKCVRGCGRGGRSVQRTEGGAILIDVRSVGGAPNPNRPFPGHLVPFSTLFDCHFRSLLHLEGQVNACRFSWVVAFKYHEICCESIVFNGINLNKNET